MTTVMPVAAPPRPWAPEREADVRTRSVDALLACIARHGLSKTTLDDVAREAGCARATLYRHFGGKRPLVAGAVVAEGERVAATLREEAAEQDSLEDAVVTVMMGAARELAGHDALRFLLAHEAELVLPFVTFDGGDKFLSHAGRALAPCFERFLPADNAATAGEWVVRLTLAYAYAHACSADAPVDLADDTSVRTLVRQFVLPGFLTTEKG
ncbi:MAG: TetR/AcrR family transcriptional regulator [Actinobacteria bacterium]|nr:TetR/AcrR family transcriptional regulator [Actinomycetota bacterium]